MQAFPLSLIKSYFLSYSGLPNACYQGIVLSLIESIFIGIYYYLFIYFTTVLHLNISISGIIISCYGVGAIAGGILGGRLSDKFSPGIISVGSLLIQSIAYMAFVKLHSIIFLMINTFILGIASYSFITANYLWVLNFCIKEDDQKLKAINILSTASNLGLGLSAIIISQAIYFGFPTIFLTASILLLILSYITFMHVKSAPLSIVNNFVIKKTAPPKIGADSITSKKMMVWVLLSVFFVGLIVSQSSSTYAIYIKESYPQLGLKGVTLLFALNSFMVVIFGTLLGEYIKKFNKIKMVGIGSFLIGFGMLLLIFPYSFNTALIACAIYTFGEIIFFCMSQLVCYQNSAQNKKGHGLGMYRMIYASSRIFGPAIGGVIYTQFGGKTIWIVSGIIGLLFLFSSYHYQKYDHI